MLKAGSLVYALVISVIIAMLSSSLILLSYFTSNKTDYYSDMERVQLNTLSGISMLLSDHLTAKEGEKIRIDIFGKGTDSVQLQRKHWGAFEIGISEAFSKHNTFKKIAFIGKSFLKDTALSLYLEDKNKALSLCGRTIIKGACYLPKSGVKRAYIEGQNFIGEKLIDGQIKGSLNTIPGLDKVRLDSIASFFYGPKEQDSSLLYEQISDSLINSFYNKPVFLFSPNKINLSGKKISGNVIIVSSKEIKVEAGAVLKDVMLYAPKVCISKYFSGSLQVFASDSLLVDEECTFHYPSVLGLVKSKKSLHSPVLIIKEDSKIEGGVIGYQDHTDSQHNLLVSLDKNVEVSGYVYSNGLLDLKGTVLGTVICSQFILMTPSAVYENHLLNAEINRSRLSKYFVGFDLFHETEHRAVVKWLQ